MKIIDNINIQRVFKETCEKYMSIVQDKCSEVQRRNKVLSLIDIIMILFFISAIRSNDYRLNVYILGIVLSVFIYDLIIRIKSSFNISMAVSYMLNCITDKDYFGYYTAYASVLLRYLNIDFTTTMMTQHLSALCLFYIIKNGTDVDSYISDLASTCNIDAICKIIHNPAVTEDYATYDLNNNLVIINKKEG
jgi:hypothetical protein